MWRSRVWLQRAAVGSCVGATSVLGHTVLHPVVHGQCGRVGECVLGTRRYTSSRGAGQTWRSGGTATVADFTTVQQRC